MVAIRWSGGQLLLLDQRKLPHEESWLKAETSGETAAAIRDMVVRGAPAIAIAGAYGLAMAVAQGQDRQKAMAELLASRPTAVNLRWALERLSQLPDGELEAAASAMHAEDLRINRSLSAHGAPLLQGGVLTICNTGSLATGGHGTALGMIRTAHEQKRDIHVYALETRPYLQGARLTVYECLKSGIPCTLLTDGMAGALMASGNVDAAVAGCDRVAANGDTANKIGTYGLAVLCRHHGIPFYIAMPTSTMDPTCPNGTSIPIEERDPDEVRRVHGVQVAPAGAEVWNPSFDVTPASLISAWITEDGILEAPFNWKSDRVGKRGTSCLE
jgi:methylthioribose-1-phosphate isomerase